jgi:hypothetical protein
MPGRPIEKGGDVLEQLEPIVERAALDQLEGDVRIPIEDALLPGRTVITGKTITRKRSTTPAWSSDRHNSVWSPRSFLFGPTLARVQSGRMRGSPKSRSTLGSKRVSALMRDPASVTTMRLVARNTSPVGSRE